MDLFDNVWGDKAEIVVDGSLPGYRSSGMLPMLHPLPASQHDLHKISLFVISAAGTVICATFQPYHSNLMSSGMMLGFGRRITAWTSDLDIPPGHQMTFKDALHILSTKIIMKIIVPEWAKNF